MYDKDAFNNWAIKGLKKSTIYMDKINQLLKSNNIARKLDKDLDFV